MKKVSLILAGVFMLLTILVGCSSKVTKESTDVITNNNVNQTNNSKSTEQLQLENANKSIASEKVIAEDEDYYGEWTISKEIASQPVLPVGVEDVNKIIGKKIILSSSIAEVDAHLSDQGAELDKVIFNSPIYKKSTVSEKDFTANYKMSSDRLNIAEKPIQMITVTDKSNEQEYKFYIKDKDTLIINMAGIFLELKKK